MTKEYLLGLTLLFACIGLEGQAKEMPARDASGTPAESRKDALVGEFVLDRENKEIYRVLPKKKEYERIYIQKKDGKYEVVYYGVDVEDDHNFVGVYVVIAEDVHVNGNEISFAIGNRNFYPPDHPPRSLEEGLAPPDPDYGGINNTMLMTGKLSGKTLTFTCQSDDCYSNVMVFKRK